MRVAASSVVAEKVVRSMCDMPGVSLCAVKGRSGPKMCLHVACAWV
jgi:hypothetical protein